MMKACSSTETQRSSNVLPARLRFVLCGAFFLTYAGVWLTVPLKIGVFVFFDNIEHEPFARLGTLMLMIPLITVYNKLLCRTSVSKLCFTILASYGVAFTLIAFSLAVSGISSKSTVQDEAQAETVPELQPSSNIIGEAGAAAELQRNQRHFVSTVTIPIFTRRWLGWAIFVIIESYCALVPTMLWSVVSFVCTHHSATAAARAFSQFVTIGTLGAICGSYTSRFVVHTGFSLLFVAQACICGGIVTCLVTTLKRYHEGNDRCDLDDRRGPTGNGVSSDMSDSAETRSNSHTHDVVELMPCKKSPGNPLAVDNDYEQIEVSGTNLTKRMTHANEERSTGRSGLKAEKDPSDGLSSSSSPKWVIGGGVSLLEGIEFIMSRPYVLGIAAVSTFPELLSATASFQMRLLASKAYSTPGLFSGFMGTVGVVSNAIALVLSVTSTRAVITFLGERRSLLVLPCVMCALAVVLAVKPMLWIAFFGVVFAKGLRVTVQNPAKEILYLHTDREVKFRAKSWIDAFGMRLSKAVASILLSVIQAFTVGDTFFQVMGLVTCVCVAVWCGGAMFVGKEYDMHSKKQQERKEVAAAACAGHAFE